ncbi:MAG TPA: ABC transporter permease [Gaiellales bacterium]|jgi:ABC-type nitrate/sulfonate/bicarbonate transport system permease component
MVAIGGTRSGRLLAPAAVLALCVVGWDLATRAFSVSSSVLPSPGLVIRSTWDDRSSLWPAIETTTKEAVFGIAVAIVVAVVLAIVIDWSPLLRRAIYPLIVASQTLPIIALAPLVVIWFGFGPTPKIVLVALFTFFSIAVGLVQGLASADHDTMSLLRTMGASRLQLLLHARLPSAVPQFFTGLKIAVTYSYVSAIVAEFVGAQQGLGVYMTTSKNAFRTDLVFGAVLVTAALTLVLFGLVVLVERLAMPWRRPTEADVRW